MPKSIKEKKKDDHDILEKLRKLAKEHKEKETSSSSHDKDRKKRHKHKKEKKHGISNSKTPMTKEDYEKKRSIITTEYDEETGRMRRVRATGEIMESIVTREQHLKINKTATYGDGLTFSSKLFSKAAAAKQ